MPRRKVHVTKRYRRYRQRSPKVFAKGSFRTIDPGRRGYTKLIVACPKGQYSRKRKRCKVGTQVQAVIKERKVNPSDEVSQYWKLLNELKKWAKLRGWKLRTIYHRGTSPSLQFSKEGRVFRLRIPAEGDPFIRSSEFDDIKFAYEEIGGKSNPVRGSRGESGIRGERGTRGRKRNPGNLYRVEDFTMDNLREAKELAGSIADEENKTVSIHQKVGTRWISILKAVPR